MSSKPSNPNFLPDLFDSLVLQNTLKEEELDQGMCNPMISPKKKDYYIFINSLIKQTIDVLKEQFCKICANPDSTLLFHEQAFCRKIVNKLIYLAKEIDVLLDEGILNMHLDFLELKKEMSLLDYKKEDRKSVDDIMAALEPLLFEFLVYQEHKKSETLKNSIEMEYNRKRSRTALRKISNFSEEEIAEIGTSKEINSKESNISFELDLIKKRYKDHTVHELLESFLDEYEKDLNESEEMCKVCSKKIKLTYLDDHVTYCQEKYIIKQKISNITSESNNLALETLKEYEDSNVDSEQFSSELVEVLNLCIKLSRNPNKPAYSKNSKLVSSQKKINEAMELCEQKKEKLTHFNSSCTDQKFLRVTKRLFELENQLEELYKEQATLEEEHANLREITSNSTIRVRSQSVCKSDVKSRFAESNNNSKESVEKSREETTFPSREKFNKENESHSHHFIEHAVKLDENGSENNGIISKLSLGTGRNVKFETENHLSSLNNLQTTESEKIVKKHRSLAYIPKTEYSNNENNSQKLFELEGLPSNSNSNKCNNEEVGDVNGEIEEYDNEDNQDDIVESESESNQNLCFEEFEVLKFLGQGAFGRVYLVRRISTEDLYALKVINISEIGTENQLQQIKNEHEIFKQIAGDHLVKAPFCFSEGSVHFFVMEFMPGGDLSHILSEEIYLEEERAKFVIAEIVLAIEHLHQSEIIHRDLKPENLVVDRYGHIKLTDYGLSDIKIQDKLDKVKNMTTIEEKEKPAKRRERKRRTAVTTKSQSIKIIGTPDYIAPEIINRVSIHNKSIDWWSLGVMTYEILIGARPFCGDSIEEILDNIIKFEIEWPEIGNEEGMISEVAFDFINKLLDRDFTSRLGSENAEEIKKHAFFKGVDWANIKKNPAKIKSNITNLSELSKLEEDFNLRREIEEKMGNESGGKAYNSNHLENFVRFDLLGDETKESAKNSQKKNAFKLKRLHSIKEYLSNEEPFEFDFEGEGFVKIPELKKDTKSAQEFPSEMEI